MNKKRLILGIIINIGITTLSQAGPLDADSQSSLEKTQNMLKDSSARQKVINSDPNAVNVNRQVESLAGNGQNTQAIYELSADIMGKLTQEANGDPVRMQELIMEAQKNPEAFAARWSPAQKAKLNEISNRLPASQPGVAPQKSP